MQTLLQVLNNKASVYILTKLIQIYIFKYQVSYDFRCHLSNITIHLPSQARIKGGGQFPPPP